jgi:N-acetyl-anhydromuramyl-L-alanine amidase AmpD
MKALGRAYPSIEAVLRHSEISAGRKVDPGPALDVAPLAAALEEGQRSASGKR